MPLERPLVVVDLESESREVLGIWLRDDEDTVIYNDWETGELSYAPADCVAVNRGEIRYRGPGGLVELERPA